MLDIKAIRNEPEKVREALRKRGEDTKIVDDVLMLDEHRRKLLKEIGEKVSKKKAEIRKECPPGAFIDIVDDGWRN